MWKLIKPVIKMILWKYGYRLADNMLNDLSQTMIDKYHGEIIDTKALSAFMKTTGIIKWDKIERDIFDYIDKYLDDKLFKRFKSNDKSKNKRR